MKNTPSALKWLAEKRARMAGDLERVERVLQLLQGQRAQLLEDLAAMDRSIRIYDERIDPNHIGSVYGHLPDYGKRGALTKAILDILTVHSPGWLGTPDIANLVVAHFNLEFVTHAQRKHWYYGSFRSTLKRLASTGVLERDHLQEEPTGEVVRWRIKSSASGLDALETSATVAAVAMAQAQS